MDEEKVIEESVQSEIIEHSQEHTPQKEQTVEKNEINYRHPLRGWIGERSRT